MVLESARVFYERIVIGGAPICHVFFILAHDNQTEDGERAGWVGTLCTPGQLVQE